MLIDRSVMDNMLKVSWLIWSVWRMHADHTEIAGIITQMTCIASPISVYINLFTGQLDYIG